MKTSVRPASFIRKSCLTVALVFSATLGLYAQVSVYQQNFDSPIGVNGDTYFNTPNTNYNGITDGSSSGGITTGASSIGNHTTGNGINATGFSGLSPTSGAYFLAESTIAGFIYSGGLFSTSGTIINILPNSTYRLSFDLGQVNNVNQPGITPSINSVALGGPVTPTAVNAMQHFTFTYNSGANNNATIELDNNQPSGNGNDFAIDSIQFSLVQASFPLDGLRPNQSSIARNLSSGQLNQVSTPVYSALIADPASYPGILDQLSPEEFGRFTSITAFNTASFETQAMDDYLSSKRTGPKGTFLGGNGAIDASGLVVNDPTYDPALAMVHSRLLAWNSGPANGLLTDTPGTILNGVDMTDTKDMKLTSTYNDPWNVFVRGNVILAQGFSQSDVGYFSDNTESVVVGTDYRIIPNFLMGLTFGYGHTDANLDNAGSSARVDSYSPGIYASYANGGWYANFIGDYLRNDYTQSRVLPFLGQAANSTPTGNEGVADLDGGYDFHQGALTFGPVVGAQYTHLTVNGYGESGSVADLQVNEQQADSLRSRLGARVSYLFSCHGMGLTPHFSATWQHEFMDQSRGITSQFDNTGLVSFSVETENPQRDFALVDAGMAVDVNQTVSVFADYMAQAGQSNYFGQSVQAGVKIGF